MSISAVLLIIVVVIIILFIAVLLWIIGAKNKIMKEEQNVFTEYNNAKLVVDRRFKNLESTVNLMKSHNKAISEAYEKVIAMRNPNTGAESDTNATEYAQMDEMMKDIVKNINVTVERYPELGQLFDANQFSKTMAQHDRDVEMSKKLYNHEVEEFNTLIQKIPYNFFATGKNKHPYWEVKNSEEKDEFIPTFD